MITNFKRNCMGTIDFDGQFKGMRKAQSFIIYPIKAGAPTEFLLVQSSTRIGRIGLTSGTVTMSPPRAGGSYGHHLPLAKIVGALTSEELLLLKSHVFATAHGDAGRSINRVIGCDNSGALEIFGATA